VSDQATWLQKSSLWFEGTATPKYLGAPGERKRWDAKSLLLIAFPVYVIVVYSLVWLVAVGKSGFWADDFINMQLYHHSLGDLFNYHGNTGKYTINLYWGLMTTAFGSGSDVPYLVVNSLCLIVGVGLWVRWGVDRHWRRGTAYWILALFLASGAWLEAALWASNIVHTFGYLALGLAMTAHERCMRATTRNEAYGWSVATGLCFTAAVMSNLIYLGLIVLGAYCAWLQLAKMRDLGIDVRRGLAVAAGFAVVLPAIFVAFVAYPGTKTHQGYTNTGFQYIRDDLHYYREQFAPAGWLEGTYIGLAIVAFAGALEALRRKDLFPLALLVTGIGVAIPVLMQSTQLYVHYMCMPLLMLFSALGVFYDRLDMGRTPLLARGALLAAAIFFLAVVFGQAGNFRYYFSTTPYGSGLKTFRTEVGALEKPNTPLCLTLDMSPANRTLLQQETDSLAGFAAQPINSTATYFLNPHEKCPASYGNVTHVRVTMGPDGNWRAFPGRTKS
jgi:hypothetical protein